MSTWAEDRRSDVSPLERTALAVDIGGSSTRMALVNGSLEVAWATRVETPRTQASLLGTIGAMASQASRYMTDHGMEAERAAVAVPAPVNRPGDQIGPCPNLPFITGSAFLGGLREILGSGVLIINDAGAAVIGEQRAGRGVHQSDLVLLVLGTGIGMGAIVDGRVLHGASGAAGEVGFLPTTIAGGARSGNAGLMHERLSGPRLEALGCALRPAHALTRVPEPAVATDYFDAARLGDPLGQAVLKGAADALMEVLTVVARVLDPAMVLLAGGVGVHDALIEETRRRVRDAGERFDVLGAMLGDDAGLVGAAAIAFDPKCRE